MKIMRTIVVGCMSALLVLGLMGCGGTAKKADEAVAATVNGENILESTVTDYIQSYRAYAGYESDADWATFMANYGYSAAELREQVINYYAQEAVIRQAAAEAGITVDADAIEEEIMAMRTSYGYEADEDWANLLDSMGYTEEEYLAEYESSYIKQALLDKEVPSVTPTDEQTQEYANLYGSYYYAGKRSSHILFKVATDATDEAKAAAKAKADECLAGLQASANLAADFAAKAIAVSEDGSAQEGGDVGWDCLNSFMTEYSTALDALEVGQMSGVVESTAGYHIILCTEEYKAAEDGTFDLAAMPADIRTKLDSDVASYTLSNSQSTYVDDLVAAAEIVINDMPEGLIYDVDMNLATSPEDTNEAVDTHSNGASGSSATANTNTGDNTAATGNTNTAGGAAATNENANTGSAN